MCPAWLTVTPDRKYVVNPGAGKTIRQIFDWKLQGLGIRTIEQKLNACAQWTPPQRAKRKSSGWRASYIKKILASRAVIGEHQCHELPDGKGGVRRPIDEPIADYYPAVVTPDVFYAVQETLRKNKGKGGRTGKAKNSLTHMVKCAYCGGSMRYVDKGPSPKVGVYLVCDHGARGVKCKRHTIRYDEVLSLALDNCPVLRPQDVLPAPDENAKLCRSLNQRVAASKGKEAELDGNIANLMDQIVRTKSATMRDRYEAQVLALEQQKADCVTRRAKDEAALREASAAASNFEAWQQDLAALREQLKQDSPEIRQRLRSRLRDLIDRIDVYAVGHAVEFDHNTRQGDPFEEWLDAHLEETPADDASKKELTAFVAYFLKRRMSKEGRFIRVYFKAAEQDSPAKAEPRYAMAKGDGPRKPYIQLPPAGSLADGIELRGQGKLGPSWEAVAPDIAQLWNFFRNSWKNTRR